MGPTNKVLTVAYGTFSCTLEGFDDPFSTMRDIAEYFRALAERDRYFGAEPPQPDMAMLRHIAETAARGRVDAVEDETGVTLRPAAVAAPVEAPAADDEIEAGAEAEPAAGPDADGKADAAVQAMIAQDAPLVAEAEAVEVAAVTDEAVADEAPEAAPTLEAEDAVDVTFADRLALLREAAAGEDLIAGEASDEADAVTSEVDADPASAEAFEEIAAEVEAPEIEAPVTEASDDEAIDEAADASDAAEDTIAALMAAAETVSAEVEMPMDEADAAGEADGADEADGAPSYVAEPVAEAALGDADEARPSGPRVIRVRRLRSAALAVATDATVSDAPSAAETDTGGDATLPADDEADLMAELAAIEAELSGDEAPAVEAPAVEAADEADEVEVAPAAEAEMVAEAGAETVGEAEDEDVEDGAEAMVDATDDSLSAVSMLMAESVAASERDAEAARALMAEAEREERKDRARRVVDDASMDDDRLFHATDSELSGEETSRRHANISHLKAAVAARRADGSIGERAEDDSGAYREDLAATVRPRRPVRSAAPAAPAPLVLASEQRVDAPAPAKDADATDGDAFDPHAEEMSAQEAEEARIVAEAPKAPLPAEGPIRPRRVVRRAMPEPAPMPSAAAIPADAPDFEAFAEEVGAEDLADVLEAAVAYAASVMKQETFSRPRLLHLVAEAHDDFSREDGLRSFGQLLREGRIRKVSRGVYAPGDGTRYAEEAQRLAS